MDSDTFVRDTFTAISTAATMPGEAVRRATPDGLVVMLREAEARTAGTARELWGLAAANADAAAWICDDTDTSRQLWAVARDYAERASVESGHTLGRLTQ